MFIIYLCTCVSTFEKPARNLPDYKEVACLPVPSMHEVPSYSLSLLFTSVLIFESDLSISKEGSLSGFCLLLT